MKAFLAGAAAVLCLPLLGLSLAGTVQLPSATGRPLGPQDPSSLALIAIEDAGPETLPDLLAQGFLVIWNGGDFLLAAVDREGRERLVGRGIPWTLLDDPIAGKTYWVASPVRASDEAGLGSRARVLRLVRGTAVIEAPPDALGDLLQHGLHAAQVFLEPVRPFRHREGGLVRRSTLSPVSP